MYIDKYNLQKISTEIARNPLRVETMKESNDQRSTNVLLCSQLVTNVSIEWYVDGGKFFQRTCADQSHDLELSFNTLHTQWTQMTHKLLVQMNPLATIDNTCIY